jgi:hypothetical protein
MLMLMQVSFCLYRSDSVRGRSYARYVLRTSAKIAPCQLLQLGLRAGRSVSANIQSVLVLIDGGRWLLLGSPDRIFTLGFFGARSPRSEAEVLASSSTRP